MKTIEYIIVKADTLIGLVERVNKEIGNGFSPIGSVTFVPVYSDNSGKSYVQAMVKYELE
jgi:hypothetical protein